jgi:hypothetical protein
MEIGQLVKWTVGIMDCHGIYLEEIDEKTSTVQCCIVNGKSARVKIEVLTELLEEESDEVR